MKLNDEILKETFVRFDGENDPVLYRVYGTVTATVGKMLLLGSFSAIANQYFLVGFSHTRMILIRLNALGKPKESTIVPFRDIRKARISGWMFGMGKKIYFSLADGSRIKLKVNKMNVMLKEQRDNLDSACELLSAGFNADK